MLIISKVMTVALDGESLTIDKLVDVARNKHRLQPVGEYSSLHSMRMGVWLVSMIMGPSASGCVEGSLRSGENTTLLMLDV